MNELFIVIATFTFLGIGSWGIGTKRYGLATWGIGLFLIAGAIMVALPFK